VFSTTKAAPVSELARRATATNRGMPNNGDLPRTAMATEDPFSGTNIPEEDAKDDLPLTMAASVVLRALPRDTHAALRTAAEIDTGKVTVFFKAVGGAPVLDNQRARISASQRFEKVVLYLRKQLKCKPTDNLFLYVNSVFAPALDENVGNLFRVCTK
jgi:ubiquitin-like protein ATG12